METYITLTIPCIKMCQKHSSQPSLGHELYFLLMFPIIISVCLQHMMYRKVHILLSTCLFILH